MKNLNADALVRGACPHDCPDTCSLLTHVRDGVALAVRGNPDHPATAGVLCTKVARYDQRTYHPERLLQPLKRVGAKGEGRFEPVSWDAALADIAQRLRAIAAEDAQAIAPYSYGGTMGLAQGEGMAARFFNALGASRLDRSICASAGGEALRLTYGAKVGMRVEHFAQARLVVIWGGNPVASSVHFWHHAHAAQRAGAHLVAIDPRRSETAQRCDSHLALRPGTDGALALALMQRWISTDALDADYIARHTRGWAGLRERALRWSPERAAAECGLPLAAITDLADRMAACARAGQGVAIRLNYGVQRVHGGGNAVRLIAALPALIGAWRHPAGGLLLSSSGWARIDRAALERPDLLAGRHPRTLNMSRLADWLNHPGDVQFGPPVRALLVYNSNPAIVAPDSTRVRRGLLRPDLFTVVLEHFMTDSARCADYVLPATTQLEHLDVVSSYGHTDVLLNQPAIAPLGQTRPNSAIFRELAARMGLDDPCLRDSDAALCRAALGDALDWAQLQAQGWAAWPGVPAQAPFAQGGFPTDDGRCHFDADVSDAADRIDVSARPEAVGRGRWADYVPNHERPWARADDGLGGASDPRHPLALISPPERHFLNSSFVNVASLAALAREPVLEMHPDDAAARAIAEGDAVLVRNDRGCYAARARLNGRARAGVVNALGLWWRRSGTPHPEGVNALTHSRPTDLGGGPCFYDCAVEVEKLPK